MARACVVGHPARAETVVRIVGRPSAQAFSWLNVGTGSEKWVTAGGSKLRTKSMARGPIIWGVIPRITLDNAIAQSASGWRSAFSGLCGTNEGATPTKRGDT